MIVVYQSGNSLMIIDFLQFFLLILFFVVDIVPLPAPISVEKPMEPSSPYVVTPEMRSLLKKKKRKLGPEQVFGGEFVIHALDLNSCLIC